MRMTEKQWEKKWAKKLHNMPSDLETMDQLLSLMQATVDRYEVKNKPADAILLSGMRDQLVRLLAEGKR